MTDASFHEFLERSLRLLEKEAPRAEAALRRRLGGLVVELRVDDESLAFGNVGGQLSVAGLRRSEHARLVTSRAALRQLLNGKLALLDAVLGDALELVGPLDELLTLDECLQLYLHGAVRCESFPSLLREFLGPSESSRNTAAS